MKHLIFSVLFFISQMNSLMAQIFTGKLLSTADSTAVAYAHIGVPELGIGTISNQAGEFAFYNKAQTKDSILISHLTHEKIKLRLTQNINDTIIYLKPLENELNTVMVVPTDSVNKWFLKAVRNIDKNYPSELHFFDAFYRETQYEGEKKEKYTRLIEADISVQDRSYKQSQNNIRILVNQLRKSDDNAKKMLFVKVLESVFGKHNFLQELISVSPVRNYYSVKRKGKVNSIRYCELNTKREARGKKSAIKCLRLKEKIINEKGDLVYVIEGRRNIFSNHYFLYTFYINVADFAFLKINSRLYMDSKIDEELLYQYVKVDDTYCPFFFKRKRFSGKKVSIKGRGMGYSESILFVNAHYRKKQHDKIRNRFKLDVDNDLYEAQYPYDPLFWKNYNMLLREPLKKKVVTDLSTKESLQTQFEENGKD